MKRKGNLYEAICNYNKILNSCDFLYTENARNKIYEDLLKDNYNI